MIGAPFADSYMGRVGIFYGKNAASWTSDMGFADADTVISGAGNMFFVRVCADFDGDGNADLGVGVAKLIIRRTLHNLMTYFTATEPFRLTLMIWTAMR